MSRDDNVRNFDDHAGDGRDGVRDDRLSALYRAHLMGAAPSSTSDAHVLRMAGEAVTGAGAGAGVGVGVVTGAGAGAGVGVVTGAAAVTTSVAPAVAAVPAAVPAGVAALARARPAVAAAATRSGWRAWLNAPWFGPGLAFATVASLSVVVIALMPKEEMAVEKEVASAPASSAAPASASSPAAAGTLAAGGASALTGASPAPGSRSDSPAAADAARDAAAPITARSSSSSSTDQALSKSSTASPASPASSPRANASRAKAATSDARSSSNDANAAGVAPGPASSMRADVASAVRQERTRAQPNPFPAQPSLATAPAGATTPPPPPPTATFAEGTRPEKQSLQSEVTEPRAPAPIAEVPDSAPTYPNESRPSIPLPYSYTMPRKSRDANGSAAASPRASDKAEKSTPPLLAAAATHHDPAQWVKAILKLKSEGKTEQLTKELADFRKQYPQYVLPEELRQIR